MSYSAICSATLRARSTESNAYCASTISVISGPAACAHLAGHGHHPVVGPREALVRVRAREGRLELGRGETQPPGAGGPAHHRLEVGVERRHLRLERRVRRERGAVGLAPQLPARHPCDLPPQIPERDVDRADRVHQRAAPAAHAGADVELLPDRLDVGRVTADQERPQPAIHRVGARRLDARAGDPGVQVGLADPGDALVGLDLDHDGVLRRARGARRPCRDRAGRGYGCR